MSEQPPLISREDARAQNDIYYFTGQACLRGHIAYRDFVDLVGTHVERAVFG